MKRIAVTGGSGSPERGIGAAIIRRLAEEGFEVVNLDIAPPRQKIGAFRQVDLTHYGDTFAAMAGCDTLVHLAANANPDFDPFTGAQRFHTNTLAAYNAFQAAIAHGMEKVVWASSETVLGYPYDKVLPQRVPTHDDDPPIPTGSYGMSKVVLETLCQHMNRVHGTPFIGLRFSNIYYDIPGHDTGYDHLPPYWQRPEAKLFNLWGYVDYRDVLQSILLALRSDFSGARNFTIAAADTNMKLSNEELVARYLPGTILKPGTGPFDTLIGIDRARAELGYAPGYSWRDHLG